MGSMLVAICMAFFVPNACLAQKKYPDPYHPEVKRIADLAAGYLEENPGGLQESAICALAVVEYYKRYDAAVPKDNAMVSKVCADIAAAVDGDSPKIFTNREVYFPCMAVILLAEFDAERYHDQIVRMIDMLVERQMEIGSFSYSGQVVPDTSQSQFGALAFYVVRQHKFPLPPASVEKLLNFFIEHQQSNGTWNYRPRRSNSEVPGTNSIHSASLSSVYLLGDMLRLQPRIKNVAAANADTALNLPQNVSIYIAAKEQKKDAGVEELWGGDGAVSYTHLTLPTKA